MDDPDEGERRPSTAPESMSVTVSGIVDSEKATEFAHLLAAHVRAIGTILDVSRLDGLHAADDYPAALEAVDRGFQASQALRRSENVDMVGMAMTVFVVRDGVPKAHLVFDIEAVLPLYVCEQESPERRQAVQLIAHECAHIEDLKRKDEAFPGVILQPREAGWVEQVLGPVGLNFWEEYYACRRTARFRREAIDDFAGVLISCLDNAPGEVRAAIERYRLHHDLDRLIADAVDPAMRPLKAAAYLFGHIDGWDGDWDMIPEVRERLRGHPIGELAEEMLAELHRLWECRDGWIGLSEFDELTEIAVAALEMGGIRPEEFADGRCYLHVP
ncbi:MAG: hypothetical protein ACXW27_00255 [Allosphingosinicella sp.]